MDVAFNKEIKEIFHMFKNLETQKWKSKLHISEMQSKMVRGLNAEPQYAITILGPKIWNARDEIVAEDAQFFLKRRYDIDVQRLSKEHGFSFDSAINTINFMKEAYQSADRAFHDKLFERLKSLLSVYSQFVIDSKTGK